MSYGFQIYDSKGQSILPTFAVVDAFLIYNGSNITRLIRDTTLTNSVIQGRIAVRGFEFPLENPSMSYKPIHANIQCYPTWTYKNGEDNLEDQRNIAAAMTKRDEAYASLQAAKNATQAAKDIFNSAEVVASNYGLAMREEIKEIRRLEATLLNGGMLLAHNKVSPATFNTDYYNSLVVDFGYFKNTKAYNEAVKKLDEASRALNDAKLARDVMFNTIEQGTAEIWELYFKYRGDGSLTGTVYFYRKFNNYPGETLQPAWWRSDKETGFTADWETCELWGWFRFVANEANIRQHMPNFASEFYAPLGPYNKTYGLANAYIEILEDVKAKQKLYDEAYAKLSADYTVHKDSLHEYEPEFAAALYAQDGPWEKLSTLDHLSRQAIAKRNQASNNHQATIVAEFNAGLVLEKAEKKLEEAAAAAIYPERLAMEITVSGGNLHSRVVIVAR